jgi:hypothetical protein
MNMKNIYHVDFNIMFVWGSCGQDLESLLLDEVKPLPKILPHIRIIYLCKITTN